LIWSPDSRHSVAFAEVIAQVQQAKSVRFKATTTVQLPNQGKQIIESTMTIAGNRMRQEMPDMVTVMDFEKGEMLSLQPKSKEGTRITMQNVPPNVKNMNLMEQFRTIKPEQARDLGDKEIDGRKLRGFVVNENSGQSLTVWADAKTQTPVVIESSFNMPSIPATSSIMKDFDWNATIDVSDLSLDAPEGYSVQSLTLDASQPVEKDLIEGLRTLAKLNGGEFTASFDVPALGGAFARQATTQKGKDMKALQAELMPKAMTISRGIAFITPASGEDFHYAGKGAKLGEKDRPVLWYQPKGSKTYRVIDAGLNAKDVAQSELPKIESRKLLPGPTPFPATRAATKPAASK
jgi:hypothetical protein